MPSLLPASARRAGRLPWLALCVAVLLLVACRGEEAAGTTPAGETGTATGTATAAQATSTSPPDAEQVLVANLTAEPATLDPQRAADQVSLSVVRNLYSGLLRLDPNDELVPDLAEEIPTVENGGISEDGLTYTFRLREGLTWSDGTPLVAQAFVDAARHLFEPGSGNRYADFYRMIAADTPEGDANVALQEARAAGVVDTAAVEQQVVDGLRVEAPDERTVVYHLNRNSPLFLLLSSLWPLYPIRDDLRQEHGPQWTEAGTLVSNGPFVLAEWQHGERIRLERNEHWHGGDVPLDAVELDMIADSAVAFLAYQNDELDIVLLGPAELVQVRRDGDLRPQFRGYAQLATLGVYPNADDPLLGDPRVRRAFAGALERVELTSAVLEGNALPAYSWIPPGMPGHDPDAGTQFQDGAEEARALLAEAGAEGIEVTLLVPEASVAVLTGEWLQEQWQQHLGVTVRLDVREPSAYVEAFQMGDYQLAYSGWGADYPDPQNWLTPFRSGSPFNTGGFADAEFDRLVEEAEQELDFEQRIALYQEAQRILVDNAGVIALHYRVRGGLVKPWVQGLEPSSREGAIPGDLFFDRVSISGRP